MAELQPKRLTIEEFLAWQLKQDKLYELVDGLPILPLKMMTGATNNHDTVVVNVIGLLREQLRGKPCRPRSQDIGIKIPRGHIRRPDVSVDCAPGGPRDMTAGEPRVVVEVLSPSTMSFDRFRKLEEYKTVEGLVVILLIDTEAPQVAVHRRRGERWEMETLEGLTGAVELPEIDATLLLAELYDGVGFERPGAQMG